MYLSLCLKWQFSSGSPRWALEWGLEKMVVLEWESICDFFFFLMVAGYMCQEWGLLLIALTANPELGRRKVKQRTSGLEETPPSGKSVDMT